MSFRLSFVCSRLRLSVIPPPARHASTWAQRAPPLPSFFKNHPPFPRFGLRRTALWCIPLAGGLVLYFSPGPTSILQSIIASPTVIPCPSNVAVPVPALASALEDEKSIVSTIIALLRFKIWEPLLTARRFVYLFVLFVPVLICSPMLLVGKPEKKYGGDRWGAIWWYNLLVSQMERAGPTYIKVCTGAFGWVICNSKTISVSTMGRVACRSVSVASVSTPW